VILILIGLAWMAVGPALATGYAIYMHRRIHNLYLPRICRIFQEKPLFIVPRGQPRPDAEDVRFTNSDGLSLHGCYFKTPRPKRRGVIVFGLEFGSDCWSAWQYCEFLIEQGFDVFSFETRNQGSSQKQEKYDPLQWVTDYEVSDTRAALTYVKSRPDADPKGVGFFGISKGAGAGLIAASDDTYVRCCVTDGMFATASTLIPYMKHWVKIYNANYPAHLIPEWYFQYLAGVALKRVEIERHCHFAGLEKAIRRFARPLFMIHGEDDNYIKPEMARSLLQHASGPHSFWLVPGAKHNQALHVAGNTYHHRVERFFSEHLDGVPEPRRRSPAEKDQQSLQEARYCEPALGHG